MSSVLYCSCEVIWISFLKSLQHAWEVTCLPFFLFCHCWSCGLWGSFLCITVMMWKRDGMMRSKGACETFWVRYELISLAHTKNLGVLSICSVSLWLIANRTLCRSQGSLSPNPATWLHCSPWHLLGSLLPTPSLQKLFFHTSFLLLLLVLMWISRLIN